MLDELSIIIRRVGRRLLEWQKAGKIEGRWEASQYKAKADRMAHKLLFDGLKAMEPDTFVVSEEDAGTWRLSNKEDRYWLIDPLDGTASFAQGYPGFVAQAALMAGKKPLVAIVFAPVFDLMYVARRGLGAYCNGKKISAAKKKLPQSIIDNYPQPRGITKAIYDGLKLSEYIECGSIGLKICRVAEGTTDVFVKDINVKPWDLAAPHLILEESGGFVTDSAGSDIDYSNFCGIHGLIAAANEQIHRRIKKVIENN